MKKLNLALVALAAVSLASCSSEEPTPAVNGADGVTFEVQLPAEVQSRAFSDGFSALSLQAAAYVPGTGEYVTLNTAKFSGTSLTTTITLPLLNGREYDVVFWAQKPGTGAYTLDLTQDNPELTVNYANMADSANYDGYDAFYVVKHVAVTANMAAQTATLTRPLAQINVGTNDLDYDAVVKDFGTNAANLRTSLEVTAPSQMTMLTGATKTDATVDYNMAKVRPTAETFPVTGYDYLLMGYVLESTAKATSPHAIINFYNTAAPTTAVSTIDIPNLPLQRNYRTNIYGQLLTNNTTFNVTIDPIYNNPAYDIPINLEPGQAAINGQLISGTDVNAAVNNTYKNLVANAGATVHMSFGEGNYTYPTQQIWNQQSGANITLTGNSDDPSKVVIYVKNRQQYIEGANLTIENATINFADYSDQGYNGFYQTGGEGKTMIFRNCIINGNCYLYPSYVIFENCTWNYTNPKNVGWSCGITTMQPNNFTARNCTFNMKNTPAISVYNDNFSANSKINVIDCKFNGTDASTIYGLNINSSSPNNPNTKAVYTVNVDNCSQTGFLNVWGFQPNEANANKHAVVNVDGTQVYPTL